VWVLSVLKREARLEVRLQQAAIWVRLDGAENVLVQAELSLFAIIVDLVLILLDVKDLTLSWLLGLLGLDTVEESVLQVLWDGDLANVKLGLGGNDVFLVDATKRAAVVLEWASDKQKTRLELLQEHNTLASMTTSDKNEDGAWCDRGTESVLVLRKGLSVGAKLAWLVLSWIEAWETRRADETLLTVLVALDLLLGVARHL